MVGRRVRPVRYTIFLPYANQDRQPRNAKMICTTIERRLHALSPEAVPGTDGRRLGIVASSSRVSSRAELCDRRRVDPSRPRAIRRCCLLSDQATPSDENPGTPGRPAPSGQHGRPQAEPSMRPGRSSVEGGDTPKVPAFHTISEEYSSEHRSVYHDNDNRGYAAEIRPEHRGPGDRRSSSLRPLR